MNKMFLKRLLSVVLCCAMLATSAIVVNAENDIGTTVTKTGKVVTDIAGHWSEEYVKYGMENGYIDGYDDQTFRPDRTVTRSEFLKMLNNAIEVSTYKDVTFNDVSTDDWFYNEVRKAFSIGYVAGYEDNTFRPNINISRQEAAVILSRITPEVSTISDLKSMKDYKEIADWAYDACLKIFSKGYMTGDDQQRFDPNGSLTRGQAAKIIASLKQNEVLMSDNEDIDKAQSFKDVIFVNGCVVSDEIESGKVEFNNCLFLNGLKIASTKASEVVLKNCNVKEINAVSKGDTVYITATGNTEITNINASCPVSLKETSLTGEGFVNVLIDGEAAVGSIINIDGTVDKLDVYEDIILSADKSVIKTLNVNDKVAMFIRSGTVEQLNVAKGTDDSSFVLSNGVVVEKAQIDSAVSFTGAGVIEESNQSVVGTTYETMPEKLTGKTGIAGDINEDLIPDTIPESSDTDISVSTNITISYDYALYAEGGEELTARYIQDEVIELRKTSANGTKLDFTASISANKKSIIINPVDNFDNSTRYYVLVKKGKLEDANGGVNPQYSYSFTTAGSKYMEVSITPENGSTDVALDTEIVVTLPTTVYKNSSKGAISESYIINNAIELREGSSNGPELDYDLEIYSNRKFTLTPTEPLERGTTYYVIVNANSLYNANNQTVSKTTSYFRTNDAVSAKITPTDLSTAVELKPQITIKYEDALYKRDGSKLDRYYVEDSVVELYKSSVRTTNLVEIEATVSADRKTITVSPIENLTASTRYYVVVNGRTVKTSGGDYNIEQQTSFTTGTATTPSITPKNGATGVSLDTDIVISFAEKLYQYNATAGSALVELTKEYLEEDDRLIVRAESATSGDIIDCDIAVRSTTNSTYITLTPKQTLETDLRYYVVLADKVLMSGATRRVTIPKFTSYFRTIETMDVVITPNTGKTNVSTKTKITIEFDEVMYNGDGEVLKTSYVDNTFELYKEVDNVKEQALFNSQISNSGSKTTITLTPTNELDGNTKYFVVIPEETLLKGGSKSDEYNTEIKSYFTTGSQLNSDVRVVPQNGKKEVSLSSAVSITFGSRVYAYDGSNPTATILKRAFSMYKQTGTRYTAITFEAEISNDAKTITLIPTNALDKNTTYKVSATGSNSSALYFDVNHLQPISFTDCIFTTGDGKPKFNVTEQATSLDVEITSQVSGTLKLECNGENLALNEDAYITADEPKELVIENLIPETQYTFKATVTDTANKSLTYVNEARFTTGALIDNLSVAEKNVNSATISFNANAAIGRLYVEYYKNEQGAEKEATNADVDVQQGTKEITLVGLESGTNYKADIICTYNEYGDTITKTIEFSTIADVNLEQIVITPAGGQAIEINNLTQLEHTVAFCDSVVINATAVDAQNVVIAVNGSNVESGADSNAIYVGEGENTVTVIVTDKSNAQSNFKEYAIKLTVQPQSTDDGQ